MDHLAEPLSREVRKLLVRDDTNDFNRTFVNRLDKRFLISSVSLIAVIGDVIHSAQHPPTDPTADIAIFFFPQHLN